MRLYKYTVLFRMLNLLLTIGVCVSVAHSAALPGFEFPDYQQELLNGFDFSFGMLKQDYLSRISKMKQEAIECSLKASCSNLTEKIELLNKLFRHDAEKMKDLHEQSMQMFHRRNYIRCLDCIIDYFDAMFDEFCGTMDEVQEEINDVVNDAPADSTITQSALPSSTVSVARATVAIPTRANITS